MYLTDPIADLLTRVRNAIQAQHDKVDIPMSKEKEGILKILVAEGYVVSYKIISNGAHQDLRVYLKYTPNRESVIKGLKRISKPGRRVYSASADIPKVLGGLGIAIVSTPKGIATDKFCRKENVGGEVLCYIW